MTDKLKCPFCGSELAPHIDEWKSIRKLFICNNTGCFCWGQPTLLAIWQALIAGKKAQRQLRTVKDRCVKKIKAKEFEIHNCLYGIHVRDCEIETLQEKLRQAQDALKGIEIRVAAIRSCVQDGYTQLGERNRNIFIALELFKDLTKEITSITKQEE